MNLLFDIVYDYSVLKSLSKSMSDHGHMYGWQVVQSASEREKAGEILKETDELYKKVIEETVLKNNAIYVRYNIKNLDNTTDILISKLKDFNINLDKFVDRLINYKYYKTFLTTLGNPQIFHNSFGLTTQKNYTRLFDQPGLSKAVLQELHFLPEGDTEYSIASSDNPQDSMNKLDYLQKIHSYYKETLNIYKELYGLINIYIQNPNEQIPTDKSDIVKIILTNINTALTESSGLISQISFTKNNLNNNPDNINNIDNLKKIKDNFNLIIKHINRIISTLKIENMFTHYVNKINKLIELAAHITKTCNNAEIIINDL